MHQLLQGVPVTCYRIELYIPAARSKVVSLTSKTGRYALTGEQK